MSYRQFQGICALLCLGFLYISVVAHLWAWESRDVAAAASVFSALFWPGVITFVLGVLLVGAMIGTYNDSSHSIQTSRVAAEKRRREKKGKSSIALVGNRGVDLLIWLGFGVGVYTVVEHLAALV